MTIFFLKPKTNLLHIKSYHDFTRGMSRARRHLPDRKLNGLGAQSKAIPVFDFMQTKTINNISQ